MGVYCTGIATINHKETGKTFLIQSAELDWQCVESNERGMGLEHHHEAQVQHPSLGLLTWSVWEYPEGAEGHKDFEINGHDLNQNFEYGFQGDPE